MLEGLKAVDPETYTLIQRAWSQQNCDTWKDDIVQGEIQRACERKKLFCSMTVAGSPIREVVIDNKKYLQRITSPALALLSAYLKFCKGE
jgi:hypothetical protein